MYDRDIKELQALLQNLVDVLDMLSEEVDGLRTERDQWRGYAEELEATLKDIEKGGL